MGKYIQSYKRKIAEINEYKLNLFARLLRPVVTMILFGFIYMKIFDITKQTQIAGLNRTLFLSYIVLAVFHKTMVSPWLGGEKIWRAIKSGELTSFITKPVDYINLQLSESMAVVTTRSFYSIILFLIISFIGSLFFNVYFPTSIVIIIYYLISTMFALFIGYMFYFIVGTLTFWVGDVWSFIDVANVSQQFLSGSIIPLSISSTLLAVSNFLPFKSMVFTPVMIYLNQYTTYEIFKVILQQFIWCIVIYWLARFVYKKGLEKFEAQGG